jgi:hypothetical protein
MHKKMAKTYRRHRRANRTRRGSGPKKPSTSASAKPDFEALMARVKALAAQAQAQGQLIKPSRRSGISKSQAAKNRFKGIMEGKVSHSTTKPVSKHGSHNRPGAGEQ